MTSQTVYVLYGESGSYSDYSMWNMGVYSSVEAAVAQIKDPHSLAVEQWDGSFDDEYKYMSGPPRKDHTSEEGTYTVEPYVLDAPIEQGDGWNHTSHNPLPPCPFKKGDRIRAVRSHRAGVVVEVEDWYSEHWERYGRNITILPDDKDFIGRGVGTNGKLYIHDERTIELLEEASNADR